MNLRRAAASLIVSLAGAAGLLAHLPARAAEPNVVTTERVRAELMAYAPDGVEPGKTVWVGLHIAHKPEWHTYWKNSGDSGLPTDLRWTLPVGVLAEDIAWPVPRKIPIGTLANYGYEDKVLLPVPLIITPDFKPSVLRSELEVKLSASWLVCKKECIPEDGEFTLKIPTRSSTAFNKAEFDEAFASQPKPLPPGSKVQVDGKLLKVSVTGLPAVLQGKALEFFPEIPEVIETSGQWTQAWKGGVWTADVPLSPQRSQSPKVMPMVLALQGAKDRTGWRAEAPVSGDWPVAAATGSGVSPALAQALAQNASGGTAAGSGGAGNAGLTLWAALFGALIGGLILNLMPCVFPVLAIKVVGFAQHSSNATARRASGLAYTAGVVLSFLALGALFLALRAAGEQLGWGFQLQSPLVVALLAALFTVIGLNFAGVFEFGRLVPSGLASMQARHPVVDSFLSGVLAVAIASPCTAPFMGASVGFAVGLPAWQALTVFGAVGLGMALPYLLASLVPAVAGWMPRPGRWMETFRKLMAFPMFATVVWLVWVLGQQTGIDGAGALLALLVAMAAVIWAFSLRGAGRLVLGGVLTAALATLIGTLGPTVTRQVDMATATPAGTSDRWQAWAPGKVDQLVAAGQPVFVDFTAAWCVTCQYNKKTTLANGDVLADLASKNVALLRADWTRRDPAITAALAQLGRSGVPVYVFYRQGRSPVVLSEILGVDEVRSVIAKL